MEFSFEDILVQPIQGSDIPALQEIYNQSEEFFTLVNGQPSIENDAQGLLFQLPEGKTIKDKIVLGIYRNQKIIGVIDVIRNYPEVGVWFVGLLIIAPEFRGQGIGKKIYIALRERVISKGGKAIKISVAEQNEKALTFWKSLGFKETSKRKEFHVTKESVFVRLEDRF